MECTCVSFRGRTFIFSACLICSFLAALPALALTEFSQNDLDLLSHYYLRPIPGSVPGILERLAGSGYLSSRLEAGEELAGTAFLFARVARSEPPLAEKYREAFEKTGHPGRVFIARVFGFMGGESTEEFLRAKLEDPAYTREKGDIMRALALLPSGVDACTMPVEKASDLDMLWAEFMATGEAKAVERVIEVLGRPDVTRRHFEEYLGSGAVKGDDGLVAAIRNNLWVLADTKMGKILSSKDLDISLSVFALRPEHPREAVAFIRESLGMSNGDMYKAALKGSVAWSLMSNAAEHPRVLAICTESARSESTPVQLALLCVPACFHEDHLQLAEAVAAFREMEKADPENLDVHYHLMKLGIEMRDLKGARAERAVFTKYGIDPGRKVDRELDCLAKLLLRPEIMQEIPDTVDIQDLVRNTDIKTKLLTSYCSELFMIPIPLPPGLRCPTPMRFDIEYEKPDRLSVSRRVIATPRSLPSYERWITLGGDDYSFSRRWLKDSTAASGHDRTNGMLRMDKWVALLEANPRKEARVLEAEGVRYCLVTFPVDRTDDSMADLVSQGKKASAEVWIDLAAHTIVACEIRSTAQDDKGNTLGLMIQQVFGDFDSTGPIGPPDQFIDLSKGESRS
jgi:hypothetical protein